MIEKDILVTTKYGAMPSFAACPEAAGQYPPVILFMDAPGIREELRHMARRIAARGYFCLLPDLYYRLGHLRFDVQRRNLFAVANHLQVAGDCPPSQTGIAARGRGRIDTRSSVWKRPRKSTNSWDHSARSTSSVCTADIGIVKSPLFSI